PNDKWNDEKSTADVKSEEALNVAYHGLSKLSVLHRVKITGNAKTVKKRRNTATSRKTSAAQPHALCLTMQAGEAGGVQPTHRMPEAHAPATNDTLAMTQPRAQCPTMQAGEAGGAQPAHRMPEAHAPATNDTLAMTQPRAQCSTKQTGEAGNTQPAYLMPAAHAPAMHNMPAMTQPRIQCPTMQAGEAGGAHHVPAEHAPAIHAGTMQPYEAQPVKEQTGRHHSCMLMDTSREGGTAADKTYITLVLYKDAFHDMKQAYLQWK
ncbi:hypothetical protein QJQ45_022513, partial [Haematococcus lacustris]